jgi:oxygen-dependent protoporphyrinogen oxidase
VRHPLDGTGFLVPRSQRESRVLSGNLWMSALFPARAPDAKVLLTSYLGGARRPEAADWDDERSVSNVLSVLEPLLGLRGAPEMVRVDRHRRGLPLYHGAYQGRMRAIDERLAGLPGLSLAANYRDGISVRDRIVCGHAIARRVCTALGHRGRVEMNAPLAESPGMVG